MYFDEKNLYSDDQAVTSTADSTNIVELPEDAGIGNHVPLVVQVTEDFATLTSLTVEVITDADSAFSNPTTLAKTDAIPLADLKVGYKFPIHILPRSNEQYTKLKYTVAGSNATAGKITAGIVFEDQTA